MPAWRMLGSEETGYRPAHYKCFLPNEEDFWEAEWYSHGDGSFTPVQCGAARVGFQISPSCGRWTRPEPTASRASTSLQLRGPLHIPPCRNGSSAARQRPSVRALSRFHRITSARPDPVHLGGQGWIVSPDGELLAITSREQPIASADLDLTAAERAKTTYPRYVF